MGKIYKPFSLLLNLSLFLSGVAVYGEYSVGESLSQTTRSRSVIFCANEGGSQTIDELLVPDDGQSNRVLWLNFFESW